MKIYINQIPAEGIELKERILPQDLELDTDQIKFREPISVVLYAHRITNALTVEMTLTAPMVFICSRCLNEFGSVYNKSFKLGYQLERDTRFIDLSCDIRQEIILDYPIQALCKPDCKGLCHKCGKDLNQDKCDCA